MFVDATNGLLQELLEEFLRYALSPEGQAAVLNVGYVNAYERNARLDEAS